MLTNVKKAIRANVQQLMLVFLAFFAMVVVSYAYVSTIVRGQMLDLGEETMNTIQVAVSASLGETELVFSNTVQDVDAMLAAGDDNATILEYLVDTNAYFGAENSPMPDFMKIYGYIRDEFLDGSGWVPPEDYWPPSRPWYIGADSNGGYMYFSEPYVDAETGGMCISYSQEVTDAAGQVYGILAVDLKLDRVTDYVASQQIANNGYGMLISDTQLITTHKNPALVNQYMGDASPTYAFLMEQMNSGDVSALRFTDMDGTDSIAYFRPIFNGWHIGVITPRASYYSQVTTMGIMLSGLGLVLMVILSALLIRSQMQAMRSDEENRSKSTFLARMSHEMRTPMNAIIGMTEIARSSKDPERIQYCLKNIHSSADHLLGVINDVLDMSKIEAGKLELVDSDFVLAHMVRQTAALMGYRIQEKKQQLTIHITEDVPVAIVADSHHLAQVLTNLLSNANKFTPEGGSIDISISRLPDEGGRCVLEMVVKDSGIGLSLEQQARLFQNFEQADNSISRKYGGTGLGLAITKRIVEMMGGEPWIASEPGKGAAFGFSIKVGIGSATPDDGTAPAPTDAMPDFTGKRVLLAEDVEINREILITLLEDTHVVIDSAEDGQRALDMFTADPERYDLIFMDIHMPGMDGYEATRRIRALGTPRAAGVPIVAMTANVFREDIEKALASGMDDHVGKPLEMGEVLDKMRRYLGASD